MPRGSLQARALRGDADLRNVIGRRAAMAARMQRTRQPVASRAARASRGDCAWMPCSISSASRQRHQPRAAVRADRAGIHADRRRDGDDQSRARLAVRAGHVRRAVRRHAEAGLVPCAAGRRALALPLGTRYLFALFAGAGARRRRSACCIELCLRRTYGRDPLYGLLLTFGAAMVIEETDPARLGHRAKSSCRCPRRSPAAIRLGDLIYVQLPFLRQRLRRV